MLTNRNWKLETVPFLLLGLFTCVFLGSMFMHFLGIRNSEDAQERQLLVLVSNAIFVHGAIIAMIVVFLRINQIKFSEAFGFNRGNTWRCLLLGAGALVVVLPVSWGLSRLSALGLEMLFRQQAEPQLTVQFLQQQRNWPELIFMGFSTMLLAPVVEEMLFRGILYSAVKEAGYPRVALFGIAFIFAAYHSNLMTFIPLFLLALVLTLLYEATDNLLSCIALHALFNAANYVVLVFRVQIEALFR